MSGMGEPEPAGHIGTVECVCIEATSDPGKHRFVFGMSWVADDPEELRVAPYATAVFGRASSASSGARRVG